MTRKTIALAALVVAALAFATAAWAGDRLSLQSQIMPDEVYISGTYHVAPPAGCPAIEPSASNLAAFNRYYSARCRHYESQDVTLTFRLFHNGRLIYHEPILAIPAFGHPAEGGTFDERIFRFMLGGQCGGGDFYWKVTLADPYFRSAYNTSRGGQFGAPC